MGGAALSRRQSLSRWDKAKRANLNVPECKQMGEFDLVQADC